MAYDLRIFDQEKTLDFLASVCADGSPHITVYNSVMRKDQSTLMFGQYCQGISKENLQRNPKAAILAIGPDGDLAKGLLRWTGRKNTGEEHELFNNIPRFRYNAVYGYAYVHLLEIVSYETLERPSPLQLETGLTGSEEAARALPPRQGEAALTPIGASLFPAASAYKVLGYIGGDGYPRVIHIPHGVVQGGNRIVVGADLYPQELAQIPEGAPVAALSLVPRLGAAILVKGSFHRAGHNGTDAYLVEIEQVYNPNMPAAGTIYPMPPLQPVLEFENAADV